MKLGDEIKEIEALWYELSLPLRQDIANVYLETEEKRVGEIGQKLEALWKNKEFRLFLKKLHKEHELKGLREIFTKRVLLKTNPQKWQQEAKLRLGAFIALLNQSTKAFEIFQKNMHPKHSMPNEPFNKVNPSPQFKLVNGEHVKIAIIGAGFSGLTSAYFLLASGKFKGSDIVIIEKRKVGAGASGRAAGFCTASTEHDFIDMVELYGEEKAVRYWKSAEDGIKLIKGIVDKIGLNKNYFELNGYFYLATDEESLETLKEESQAQNQILGKYTQILNSQQLAEKFNLHNFTGALYSQYGAYFVEPAPIINDLQKFLLRNGVRIVENTEVKQIDENGNFLITAGGIQINTDKIVVSSAYESTKLGVLKGKIFALETYLALTEPVPSQFLRQHNMLYYTLMWDTDEVYTYFRIRQDGRILIGGSDVDFKGKEIKSEMDFMQHFYTYLVKHFPQLKGIKFQQQWSGIIAGTNDFYPFAGNVKGTNVYVTVSDGIPYCFLSGKIVADLITKGQSDYADLFDIYREMSKKGIPIGEALRFNIFRKLAGPALKVMQKFPKLKRVVWK